MWDYLFALCSTIPLRTKSHVLFRASLPHNGGGSQPIHRQRLLSHRASGLAPVHPWGSFTHLVQSLGMALISLIRLGAPSQKVNLLGGVAQTLIYPRPSPSLTDVGLFVRTMLNIFSINSPKSNTNSSLALNSSARSNFEAVLQICLLEHEHTWYNL